MGYWTSSPVKPIPNGPNGPVAGDNGGPRSLGRGVPPGNRQVKRSKFLCSDLALWEAPVFEVVVFQVTVLWNAQSL